MTIQYGRVEETLELSERYTLHGTTTESIFVLEGGILALHGVCEGDVVVESEGEAYIYGTVEGNVANQGGHVEIYGTVEGTVQKTDQDTTIHESADVRGEVI